MVTQIPPMIPPVALSQDSGKAQKVIVESRPPFQEMRQFSKEEQDIIKQKSNRWLPALIESYSTFAHDLLAHPGKFGFLSGTLAAGTMYLISEMAPPIFRRQSEVLASATGVFTGLGIFMNQTRKNGDVIHLMQHQPPNATVWHLKNDPVYQADRKHVQEEQRLAALMM